jgi:hypothetical protein
VNIGYCGLDRSRAPLHGDEIRPCWEPLAAAVDRSGPVDPADPGGALVDGRPLGEVPIVPPVTPRFDLSLFAEPEV